MGSVQSPHFPTELAVTFPTLAPKGFGMTVCPYTGVSLPECSCSACVEALIERHMSLPETSPDTAEMDAVNVRRFGRLRLTSRLRGLRQRRAA
jgi:hypothetical protein